MEPTVKPFQYKSLNEYEAKRRYPVLWVTMREALEGWGYQPSDDQIAEAVAVAAQWALQDE